MRLIAPLLLAACAGAPEAPALPDTAVPPPLVLDTPELYTGQRTTLEVTGANPGDRVFFLGSTNGFGPGPCPAALGGLCLDIANARPLGSAIANASGEASLTLRVPAAVPPNSLIWLQAAVPAGANSYKSFYALAEVLDPACPAIISDFQAEADAIRSCTTASECGQVLSGTSCGCTRDWVARTNADPTDFYDLLNQAGSCGFGLISTCDCPPANGFDCVNNTCTWNYGGAP
jgi:hypothetical protein